MYHNPFLTDIILILMNSATAERNGKITLIRIMQGQGYEYWRWTEQARIVSNGGHNITETLLRVGPLKQGR
jgi:hypothetical protein